jgi:hypothetical protein
MTFSDGERAVNKVARISDCAKAVSKDLTLEAGYNVLKVAREAERDLAFMKYGPDEWKKHVPLGRFWSTKRTEEEMELLREAARLLKESACTPE